MLSSWPSHPELCGHVAVAAGDAPVGGDAAETATRGRLSSRLPVILGVRFAASRCPWFCPSSLCSPPTHPPPPPPPAPSCCVHQISACDAIVNLASDNGGVQEDLVTGRGVDLINLALDTHGSDPVLCESGLTALASATDDLDVRDMMMRVRVIRLCSV